MGTSDSYVYQGRPIRSSQHGKLTAGDPALHRKVTRYADACIASLSNPRQPSKRVTRREPIAAEIAERAAMVGSRLAAAAERHSPVVLEPGEQGRALRTMLDEVFGIDDLGSARLDSLLRECAARAVSRWLRHEGMEDSDLEGEAGFDEILLDPLSAVAPELIEDAGGAELLLDEFHAELLVELIQMVAGEGMFPSLTLVKLFRVLYRWAADRILRAKASPRRMLRLEPGDSTSTRDCEKAVIGELLDLEEPTKDRAEET